MMRESIRSSGRRETPSKSSLGNFKTNTLRLMEEKCEIATTMEKANQSGFERMLTLSNPARWRCSGYSDIASWMSVPPPKRGGMYLCITSHTFLLPRAIRFPRKRLRAHLDVHYHVQLNVLLRVQYEH